MEKKSMKDRVSGLKSKANSGFSMLLVLLKKMIKLLIIIGLPILMLVIGSRLHETGALAGKLGKTYKGSTVMMSSGSCKTADGEPRIPSLVKDQVVISYIDDKVVKALIRKTREAIECDVNEVVLDRLSIADLLGQKNEAIPELQMPVAMKKEDPEYKKLEKKTLLMSGSCTDLDGNTLPSFIDEPVDVTSTEAYKEKNTYLLIGILKKTKTAVKCLGSSIKYSDIMVADEKVEGEIDRQGLNKTVSYVGKTLLITGTCYPDERTRVNKTKKYVFYKLVNAKIQVLEHDVPVDGIINKVVGISQEREHFGDSIYCDRARFPFNVIEFDEDSMKLDKGSSVEQNETVDTEVKK